MRRRISKGESSLEVWWRRSSAHAPSSVAEAYHAPGSPTRWYRPGPAAGEATSTRRRVGAHCRHTEPRNTRTGAAATPPPGLDVRPLEVGGRGLPYGLDLASGHGLERPAAAEEAVARAEPLPHPARRERLLEEQHDLPEVAESILGLGTNGGRPLPIPHGSEGRAGRERDRRLGEPELAQRVHHVGGLDGPLQRERARQRRHPLHRPPVGYGRTRTRVT